MNARRSALLCALLVGLTACGAGSIDAPEALDPAPLHRILSTDPNCPLNSECMAATPLGPADPDINVIAANCPEVCQSEGRGTGTPLSLKIDADPQWNDEVRVRCASGKEVSIMSTHTCWDCRETCAGASCPTGATCVTIKGTAGSDCRAYKCEEGWTPYTYAGGTAPLCTHIIDPNVSPAAPTTSASTINGKVHISWPAVPGAVSYHIYRQIEWMTAPDGWNSVGASPYDDVSTRVSGPPQSYPPSPKWVSYYVVSVAASGAESGNQTIHYFPYTAVIPY